MDEVQAFIRALKYHHLTSQQRKTLRGQALAGNLTAAQVGLRKIVSKGVQHGHSNAVSR
ncbi:MAG: hypothetical protein VB091_06640 [Christensenella sp.]|nr:hypothetical protein [Christensenella sp.]